MTKKVWPSLCFRYILFLPSRQLFFGAKKHVRIVPSRVRRGPNASLHTIPLEPRLDPCWKHGSEIVFQPPPGCFFIFGEAFPFEKNISCIGKLPQNSSENRKIWNHHLATHSGFLGAMLISEWMHRMLGGNLHRVSFEQLQQSPDMTFHSPAWFKGILITACHNTYSTG